uniref:Uncharacterized protein n=1 Tax=Lates calcarifer TaxID=8187 RepID=A0A4W6DY42_LATCA
LLSNHSTTNPLTDRSAGALQLTSKLWSSTGLTLIELGSGASVQKQGKL